MLKTFAKISNSFGINPLTFINSFRGLPSFVVDYFKISKQVKKHSEFKIKKIFPILADRFESGGNMKGHYFHQDLYIASKVFEANPLNHLDIGSRVDGFVAHIATFRPIEIIDIREIKSKVKNIIFRQANMMELSPDLINYTESLSALHAIEHFGLGRYGDPIDINGHLKAFVNIHKILKPDGIFYFSVPIGPQRIEFNAHRVFDVSYLIEKVFKGKFIVKSFSYVDDKGDFFENCELSKNNIETNFGCNYGCGIFILVKA